MQSIHSKISVVANEEQVNIEGTRSDNFTSITISDET